jgi:hypothetical protein
MPKKGKVLTKAELDARNKKIQENRAIKAAAAAATNSGEPGADKPPENKPEKPTNYSWLPARVLDIPKKFLNPGYRYRFVNSIKDGNELKKQSEHWEFDHEVAEKMRAAGLAVKTQQDGTGHGTTYKVRELVLMRIKQEYAEAREKYYKELGNVDPTEMRRQLRGQINTQGADSRAGVYTRHPYAQSDMNSIEFENVRR